MKVAFYSTTLSYFALTDTPSPGDTAPLQESGSFSPTPTTAGAVGGRWIREEKFTVNWAASHSGDGPSLLLVLGGLYPRSVEDGDRVQAYINNQIKRIVWAWDDVLDEFDTMMSVPVCPRQPEPRRFLSRATALSALALPSCPHARSTEYSAG